MTKALEEKVDYGHRV